MMVRRKRSVRLILECCTGACSGGRGHIIGVHSSVSCTPLRRQLGKGLGYGHVKLENAEEAKNFIYRFDGFPAVGADELKVRVSKQALQGEHHNMMTGHIWWRRQRAQSSYRSI